MLAVCTAALAITAHAGAGGSLSDSALTALLTTVLAWGGTSLARRGGLLTLVAVLGTTQATQHVLLTEVAHVHQPAAAVDGWVMFAAHAVATVLTAVLLVRAGSATAAVAAAVRWLVGRLQALSAGPPAGPRRPAPARYPARPGILLDVLLRRVSQRRGPPLHS
ncbi:hypothetical protein BU204_07260 [Actinophytocola xanthii]|uniref:MFS transporter n=1 Tax=Actinophytocola xanthii TaxID=1912961 RepID=A0A1Q8CVE3_9PSEU|nr:hypothetical protein BU204_07260 [Actinophytocola xanthii]